MAVRRKVSMEIKDFKGGSNLLLDEARLAPNEARSILNLIQCQDGLWKTRWGTAYYGADIGDTIDGATEYVKSDGTTEVIAIAGTKAYSSTDGGSWTEISGATFTADKQCYFMQIAGYLYIANGTDVLCRYNGTVLSTYTSLNPPASLTASLVASGLASGTYTYYGEVTALNDVGESVGSTEASITTNKERDNWTAGTDKVQWTWAAVASATAYQLYVGSQTGREKLLTSTGNLTYVDDGTKVINEYVEPPLQNTTTGPKFKSMALSGNRIWGTYNDDDKYMVYWSGTGTDMGKFSSFYGGGWVNLEKGGREMPTKVVHYQSGTGTGIATILCRTPEGRGAIWQISLDSITVGDVTFSLPNATKVIGSFGTDSIQGTVATTNDILFPNRRGVYSLGPEKNFYGILRTHELTAKIRDYWRSLYGGKIQDIAAYFYDSKVFFSVPTSSTGNTRMIVYDLERLNWTVEWDIAAKQFFEYTDTSGKTHLLYLPLAGSQMIELSENIQGDLGTAFTTLYVSGRMPTSKLWKDFVKINKVFIKLGSPRGAISFSVSGTEKNATFKTLKSATISPISANTGLGWDLLGSIELGDTSGTPETFADSSDARFLNIRKKLRDIQLTVSSNSFDSDYIMQGFIIEGNIIKTNPPSGWKLTT